MSQGRSGSARVLPQPLEPERISNGRQQVQAGVGNQQLIRPDDRKGRKTRLFTHQKASFSQHQCVNNTLYQVRSTFRRLASGDEHHSRENPGQVVREY